MSQHLVDSRKAALVPGVAVFLLVLFYGVFQGIFLSCPPKLVICTPIDAPTIFPSHVLGSIVAADGVDEKARQEVEVNRKILADRYDGRLLWMFVAAVGVLAGFTSLAVAALLLYRSFGGPGNAAYPVGLIVLAFASGVVLWMNPAWHMPIMKDVLQGTVTQGAGGMASIVSVMNLFNVINYVGGLALVFATCSILLPRDLGLSDGPRLEGLASQMSDLRLVLYLGTLQLVVGVLRMSSVSQWTLAFVAPGAVTAARSFSAVLVSVMGGFYTLILIATYVPAVLILSARARTRVGQLKLNSEEQQKVLNDGGLGISFRDALPRILALLAPLLAGPIGELLKTLAA